MKITICGSIHFREQKVKIKQKLLELGHEVNLHPDYEAIVRGEKIPPSHCRLSFSGRYKIYNFSIKIFYKILCL